MKCLSLYCTHSNDILLHSQLRRLILKIPFRIQCNFKVSCVLDYRLLLVIAELPTSHWHDTQFKYCIHNHFFNLLNFTENPLSPRVQSTTGLSDSTALRFAMVNWTLGLRTSLVMLLSLPILVDFNWSAARFTKFVVPVDGNDFNRILEITDVLHPQKRAPL